MRSEGMCVSAEIVFPVFRALSELGLAPIELLQQAAASTDGSYLDPESADRGLAAAARALGDDALGITIARRIPICALGTLDYAMCASADLRTALSRLVRYYALASRRSRLALIETPPIATFVLEREPRRVYGPHGIEFLFAVVVERMRQTLGEEVVRLEEVVFAHDAPPCTARHDSYFGVRTRFSDPPDRLVFASELLDRSLRTAAAALAELLERRMRELSSSEDDPFVERARRAVAELIDRRDVTLASAAKLLRTSRRTLQRELSTRGRSHKELVSEVRRERALELLSRGTLNTTEVSDRLGFSDTSAFYRAFRRWTGSSPNEFRGPVRKHQS